MLFLSNNEKAITRGDIRQKTGAKTLSHVIIFPFLSTQHEVVDSKVPSISLAIKRNSSSSDALLDYLVHPSLN